MMFGVNLALALTLIFAGVRAATTTSNDFYSTSFSTLNSVPISSLTGTQYTYISSQGQISVSSSSGNASDSQSTRSKTKATLTTLGGSNGNGTASSTTSSSRATNTIPCNGYPQFCNRQYSNITEVCAHNSAFAIKNNAGSNQKYGVTDQLKDGIRMIQGETHWVNDTVYNCHTTCELLNAGPWEAELATVVDWLRQNPYEVVTWLIVNSDFVPVENYLPAIEQSGIRQYLYEPDYVPQHRGQWPTLGEMIITGKRVVMFMDYNANQSAVPYILDEFTHMWETPFSPTNISFPCTQQRPPHLNQTKARDEYMYLANHNLNTAVDLAALVGPGSGEQIILIPNTADINQTNGQFNQIGQMEAMSLNCTQDWGRPPNFLLVDYYNYGDPKQGSVFEVAARANGVTYNGRCCGGKDSSAAIVQRMSAMLLVAMVFGVWWIS